MAMLFLTTQEHIKVVKKLKNLAKSVPKKQIQPQHPAGIYYISLMQCFLLHNLSITNSLLILSKRYGLKWFPVNIGYILARSLFETEVTAHYISLKPTEYSELYIKYNYILKKKEMDFCKKHRNSQDPQWRESSVLEWQHRFEKEESKINENYNKIKGLFVSEKKWSGKDLYQMAIDVDHQEAYESFYSKLSTHAHPTIKMADRYLKIKPNGLVWSLQSNELEVGDVFSDVASFLTCFLTLYSKEFKTWKEEDVKKCWNVKRIDKE